MNLGYAFLIANRFYHEFHVYFNIGNLIGHFFIFEHARSKNSVGISHGSLQASGRNRSAYEQPRVH